MINYWMLCITLLFLCSCRSRNSDSCMDCSSYELKAVLDGHEQKLSEADNIKNKIRMKNFISYALFLEQSDYQPQFENQIANDLINKFKTVYRVCELDAYGDFKNYQVNAEEQKGKIDNQDVNLRITDMILHPTLLQLRRRDLPDEAVAMDTLIHLKSPLKVPQKIEGLPKIENKFMLISKSSPLLTYFDNFYKDLHQTLLELQVRKLLGKCFEGVNF